MAKKSAAQVLLGFEDEFVSEKYKNQLDFTTNKVGGSPDLPANIPIDNPKCPLCKLTRPLIIQIYAPLENSGFHRTLYLFACINPKCWGSNDSWTCLRIETPDKTHKTEDYKKFTPVTNNTNTTHWCTEANDWGEEESLDFEESSNVNIVDNFEKMNIDESEITTEKETLATAEIEVTSSESQNVVVESPSLPSINIVNLLKENAPLQQSNDSPSHFEFVSYFLSVWDEQDLSSQDMDDSHIKDLLQKYEKVNEQIFSKSGKLSESSEENYEKSSPAHGDKLFQKFLTKIQENPGQILRYSREGIPLLIHILEGLPKRCQNCQGPTVFEFQLVPTIISKLRLKSDLEQNIARLDFGTILVYTCQNSCWAETDSFRIENVILQIELY